MTKGWVRRLAGAGRLFLVVVWVFGAVFAVARTGEPPESWSAPCAPLASVPVLELPAVDNARMLAEDEAFPKGTPLRVAAPLQVSLTSGDAGSWETLPGGARLWRLRVESPGATDLSFGFSRLALPPGATLHVWSEKRDSWEGPFTGTDAAPTGRFYTPAVPGGAAVLELLVPSDAAFPGSIGLEQVAHGYRDLLGAGPRTLLSQPCEVDVVCPDGDAWRDQIRSVARYTLNGTWLCSGTLLMDVPRSFRPFFLTAAHCGIRSNNADTVVVYWNYQTSACGGPRNGSLSQNQSGSTWLASKADSDFCLIELLQTPNPSFDVFYSGWDRTGAPPQSCVGIHHPSGDEKAISTNTDPLTTVNNCAGPGTQTHWMVNNWERGATEGGSSGSGIWDPATHRLVGTLTGGLSDCWNREGDCYGKFSVQWDSSTRADERLRDWLDPQGTGTTTMDGSNPGGAAEVVYVAHQGADICPSGAGNANGRWEPGETVTLQVRIQSNTGLTGVQGVLTSPTPGVTILDGTATWPNLTAGVPAWSQGPHFTIRLEPWIACGTPLDFDLVITTSGAGPFPLRFSGAVASPPNCQACSGTCAPVSASITGVTPALAACLDAPFGFSGTGAGEGALTYEWDFDYRPPAFDVQATGTTAGHLYAAPGSYAVALRVTDSCPSPGPQIGISSADITVWPLPIPAISPGCTGGRITLDAGAGYASYLWSTGAATRTIQIGNDTTTTYSVTVTDGNGCKGSTSYRAPAPCPAPGEVSDVATGEPPLRVTRDAGSGTLQLTAEVEPDTNAYNVYADRIGSWYAPAPVLGSRCFLDAWTDNGNGTLTFPHDLPAGNLWFVVTASNGAGEGGAGRRSDGAERTTQGTWPLCGAY